MAAVDYARQKCQDVEFTPEDAGRTDKAFLLEVLAAVIKAGASTVNIADTVGYNTPESFGELINYLVKNTEGSDKVISLFDFDSIFRFRFFSCFYFYLNFLFFYLLFLFIFLCL